MALSSLLIKDFRNIQDLNIEINSRTIIFTGNNGAGKTSLLEAIHYLGTGRSFRTHINQRIINHKANALHLHANVIKSNQLISLGIQRTEGGSKKARVNGADTTPATLAQHLPLQIINTTSHRFFHDGPKLRRQLLDWGVFHVKPSFLSIWKNFQRILTQRNAAIRSRKPLYEIKNWNTPFCEYGELLNQYRIEYLKHLEPVINKLLTELLPGMPNLTQQFTQGWNKNQSLSDLSVSCHL